jgi:RNA polymerase sigma-70 factor (ECF subfamily)
MKRMRNQGECLEHDGASRPDDSAAGDDDLLHAIAQGDREAFRLLMARHVRQMLAMAARITRSPDDADEIVQDTFLKVWTMARRWQTDRDAKFSTWLYRVVLNASLDRRRRARSAPIEEAGDPPDSTPGGLDQAMMRQREKILGEVMAEMPPRQRTALSLYYYSDLSAPQAAQVLDLSVSALEALLVRGKKGMRAALAKRGITGFGDVT